MKKKHSLPSITSKHLEKLPGRIILEFQKLKDNKEENEFSFQRKIVIGSCKLLDPKNEKPTAYEILLPVT
jgi:hypothetical protein